MNSHSSEQLEQQHQNNKEELLASYYNKIRTTNSLSDPNGNVSIGRSRSSSRDSSINNKNFNQINADVLIDRGNISCENSMDNSRDSSSSSSGSSDGDSCNSCLTNQNQLHQQQHLQTNSNDLNLINHQHLRQQQESEEACKRDHQYRLQEQEQQQHQSLSLEQQKPSEKDFQEVKQVELFGISIVALTINGKERLCLAQISNTLLKEFSYNEIHNRRVALGITCVQCTPIQLEMLRRAGAMPSSSRRCGMITRREAERLCRSFLVEEQPPELPENFHFSVAHRVNYGCKGRFIPARYISSRAKCIECFYCGEFYSPNKFIFHSHRQPHATDCNPPDSPNINSWRKHIDLDWTQEHSQDIKYAWEDVKSLFNGGTRRRAPNWQNVADSNVTTPTTTLGNNNSNSSSPSLPSTGGVDGDADAAIKEEARKSICRKNGRAQLNLLFKAPGADESDQLIDVECDDFSAAKNDIHNLNLNIDLNLNSKNSPTLFQANGPALTTTKLDDSNTINSSKLLENNKLIKANKLINNSTSPSPSSSSSSSTNQHHRQHNRLLTNRVQMVPPISANYPYQTNSANSSRHHLKRMNLSLQHSGNSKRKGFNSNERQKDNYSNMINNNNQKQILNNCNNNNNNLNTLQMPNFSPTFPTNFSSNNHHKIIQTPFSDFVGINSPPPTHQTQLIQPLPLATSSSSSSTSSLVVLPQTTTTTNIAHHDGIQANNCLALDSEKNLSKVSVLNQRAGAYPVTNFIYNQLYSQLIQNQQQQPSLQLPDQANKQEPIHFQQQQPSPQLNPASLDAQLALRHHLWSSLLANLQYNAGTQLYNSQEGQTDSMGNSSEGHCNSLRTSDKDLTTDINNLNFDHHHLRNHLPLKHQKNQLDKQSSGSNHQNLYNSSSQTNVIQNLPFSSNATKTFPPTGE